VRPQANAKELDELRKMAGLIFQLLISPAQAVLDEDD
jgi:hypothetical protein